MHDSKERLVYLLRNLLAVGAGNYAALVVSLAVNAMLARHLGVEQFGHLTLLLTASQVLAFIGVNWTQTALVRFGAQEFASSLTTAQAFWTRIWIVLPWLATALAAIFLWDDDLAQYLMVPNWGLFVVIAHFAASFLVLSVSAMLQATNQMRRYGAVLFFDKAVMALLLVALLGTPIVKTPTLIVGMYAGSSVAVALWSVSHLEAGSLMPVRFSSKAYKQMLGFSFPLLLSSWVGLLGTNWFDILIIKQFRPMSEVGLYSLGTVLAGVVQQITIIFSTLLLPRLSVMISEGEIDKIRLLVQRLLPYWLLTTTILFGVVLLAARPLVPMIFGDAFAPAASVLAILMVGASALALFSAFSSLITALGSTWAITGIYLTAGLVNVATDLLLIPSYGIPGAAFATVLAYATSALLAMIYVNRRLGQNVFPLTFFSLPVFLICGCLLRFNGVRFYVLAISMGGVSVVWLLQHFQLFRGEDAAFLKAFRLLALPAPGAPIR